MTSPLIILGGGGHAKVLVSTLLLLRQTVLGFVDPNPSLDTLLGVARLGDDDSVIFLRAPEEVRLVNGLGSIGSTASHRAIFERFASRQFAFETVIHPAAVVSREVRIDDGAQIMAGAVIQPGSHLGMNTIINTGARVDHDCLIGAHAHIAPGVTLSGNVHVGEGAHVGAGATVIQGRSIGAGSVVGAGAVVVKDVPPGVTVAGVPAKIVVARRFSDDRP